GGFGDLYVRNLQTGRTVLATASDSGTGGQNGFVGTTGVFSTDGSVVVFVTGASNLYEGDRNGKTVDPSSGGMPDIYAATTTASHGTISGQVFNDANGNGAKNTGESGLAGWTVFLDANHDGQHQTGESSVVSDTSGNFTFTGLAAGSYTVA